MGSTIDKSGGLAGALSHGLEAVLVLAALVPVLLALALVFGPAHAVPTPNGLSAAVVCYPVAP